MPDPASIRETILGSLDLTDEFAANSGFPYHRLNNNYVRKNTLRGVFEQFVVSEEYVAAWLDIPDDELESIENEWNEAEARYQTSLAEDLRWNNANVQEENELEGAVEGDGDAVDAVAAENEENVGEAVDAVGNVDDEVGNLEELRNLAVSTDESGNPNNS